MAEDFSLSKTEAVVHINSVAVTVIGKLAVTRVSS